MKALAYGLFAVGILAIALALGWGWRQHLARQAAADAAHLARIIEDGEQQRRAAIERDRATYNENKAAINKRVWDMIGRAEFDQAKRYAEVYLPYGDDDLRAAHANAESQKRYYTIPYVGMPAKDALDTFWGKPQSVNSTTTSNGTREQWVYSSGYLYVENGRVVAIQETR